MQTTEQMMSTSPNAPRANKKALVECVDACVACELTCVACADACLGEEEVASLSGYCGMGPKEGKNQGGGLVTTKLQIFNGALRMCGERKLASLSEDRQPRRLLDDEWADGAVDYCLGADARGARAGSSDRRRGGGSKWLEESADWSSSRPGSSIG